MFLLSLGFQQPPMIEERYHFKLLIKQTFSKFHFYMPQETSGQSLSLAFERFSRFRLTPLSPLLSVYAQRWEESPQSAPKPPTASQTGHSAR